MRAALIVAAFLLLGCGGPSEPPKQAEPASLIGPSELELEQAKASRTAGDVFRDCDACPELVAIPGGQFMMDTRDDRPIRRVTVADFAMGRYEVTFEEWEACVRGGGCRSNPNPGDQGWGRGRRPVINITWNDAQAYVQWLSARTGQAYRLPSEEEWFYADNAPRNAIRMADRPGRFAATYDLRTAPEAQGAVPVGSFAPNHFGLYDKNGNVSELTADRVAADAPGAPEQAIVAGLNWYDYEPDGPGFLGASSLDQPSDWVGFRVVRSLSGVGNPNPIPPPLSGALEPPLEGGYFVYDASQTSGCGEREKTLTLAHEVALHASRDPASSVVATARGGETVTILGCRVHFRPRRGEAVRTDYGFEAGRPVYALHTNDSEWDSEYFEHTDVITQVWHQGEIIAVNFEIPEDFFNWEPLAPGMAGQVQDGAGGGCWYELGMRGLRGWGQSEDLACYWARR